MRHAARSRVRTDPTPLEPAHRTSSFVILGLVIAAIIAVVAMALLGHGLLAVRILAGVCAIGAFYRGIFPGRSRWFAAKRAWVDVAVLTVFAVGLWLLAPYVELVI